MDFSQYLIATDLDGTFFNRESLPAPANLKALERDREGGGLFTVSTGRVHATVIPCFQGIEQVANVPGVLCNGNYLYDFATQTPYFEQYLPRELAEELLRFALDEFPQTPMRACVFRGIYYYLISEQERV